VTNVNIYDNIPDTIGETHHPINTLYIIGFQLTTLVPLVNVINVIIADINPCVADIGNLINLAKYNVVTLENIVNNITYASNAGSSAKWSG